MTGREREGKHRDVVLGDIRWTLLSMEHGSLNLVSLTVIQNFLIGMSSVPGGQSLCHRDLVVSGSVIAT